jgi:hypothetical protein
MTETNEKKVEKESEEAKKLELDEAASIKKEKKASIKELLKEAVLHAYGFEERKNAPALSEETLKFNREVWDLTLKLIEKFEGHNDPNNNLSLFLAIKCPGMGEVDEDGARADALGFTSGKMLNLAHLVNDVMEKHVELVGALVFDQK